MNKMINLTKSTNVFGIVLLMMSFFNLSCEKYLEVDLPNSQQISVEVFEDNVTATAALTNIYSTLRESVLLTGQGNGVTNLIGYYSDELVYYSPNNLGFEHFYNNSLIASDQLILSIWNDSYNLIYQTNAVIEGVNNSVAINQEDKNQLIGEAIFTRSLIYFYLLNTFGDVPYIITTDYTENIGVSRTPVHLLHQSLISDLIEAKELLGTEYLSTNRVRPNKFTVSSLLARIYLYTEAWENAELESSFVINNGPYELNLEIDEVFKNSSLETIWQFYPNNEGFPTYEALTFIFTSTPPPIGALNSDLINSFESGDGRLGSWTGNVSDGNGTFYYANKYKVRTLPSDEYSIVFRLAEQYLIRAEARMNLGDFIGSQNDINAIRNRANLLDTTALNETELINSIISERRHELFTEFGHRYFDIKRLGLADNIFASKPGWNSTDILFPIPENERIINPNLTQNPGY